MHHSEDARPLSSAEGGIMQRAICLIGGKWRLICNVMLG